MNKRIRQPCLLLDEVYCEPFQPSDHSANTTLGSRALCQLWTKPLQIAIKNGAECLITSSFVMHTLHSDTEISFRLIC